MSTETTAPLRGRTAIVTGGATGIGAAITRRLLDDGARVLVAARSQSELEGGPGEADRCRGFAGDLADPDGARAMLASAIEAFGGVDILVNNAGGGVIRPTLEHTEKSLQATVNNNLWTTIRCCLAVLPHLCERGGGRIVNIGAESVRNGLRDHAIYNAAKGGVHGLTTGLAREFAPQGVTVNVVAPSYVVTPSVEQAQRSGQIPAALARVLDEAVALIPMGRPGEVAEVAAAVAFLAREDAGFVTGQVIGVNGGSSMG
ncbi:SDR family NAD(P)-dependent oxidoreductase [Sciscionella marina]|uniref:SDR family NAD(P)-dependent oxidoreductase n=1 Tax=Sciscionella marina TaxID=508770 RepID=UPI00036F9E1C|nr:SDR family oxidoreductase [Sciscionella marina]